MMRILAEESLEAEPGQVFLVGGDGDVFLHLDRLVQPMPPGSVGHDAAGEFVDDLDFPIVVDEILFIADEAVTGRSAPG